MVLIACVNDVTVVASAYDHVLPSRRPERWYVPALAVVATVCGAVAAASSLLLLFACLAATVPGSILGGFAEIFVSTGDGSGETTAETSYGRILTVMFLKVALSSLFTMFATRTTGPCYERAPGAPPCVAAVAALSLIHI